MKLDNFRMPYRSHIGQITLRLKKGFVSSALSWKALILAAAFSIGAPNWALARELEILICRAPQSSSTVFEDVYLSALLDQQGNVSRMFGAFTLFAAVPGSRAYYQFAASLHTYRRQGPRHQLTFTNQSLRFISTDPDDGALPDQTYTALNQLNVEGTGSDLKAHFLFSGGQRVDLLGCTLGNLSQLRQILPPAPPQPPPQPQPLPPLSDTNHSLNETLFESAARQVGSSFKPGQTARCMDWVREVLSGVCGPHMRNRMTRQPWDTVWTAPLMANSLAGPDMGMPIWRRESLQRGDIVFLYNTYGNFPEGTITHVGIYAGEGAYIHRPTSDRPVTHSALNGRFAGALRLSESICKN